MRRKSVAKVITEFNESIKRARLERLLQNALSPSRRSKKVYQAPPLYLPEDEELENEGPEHEYISERELQETARKLEQLRENRGRLRVKFSRRPN